ncbi:MAG: hypothetical protein RMJ07_06200 [Nitrososphaerota archaeon]|nr:hypothetical protein [Nitrososphaerota archaeon]
MPTKESRLTRIELETPYSQTDISKSALLARDEYRIFFDNIIIEDLNINSNV